MRPSTLSAPHISDAHKTQLIRARVTEAGERARARHPWLAHQDLIGLSIQLGSVAGMLLCAWAYVGGHLPAWATIIAVGVFASLTHEIEHDLIHQLYFKKRPWVQDVLLGLGWLARPSTINPWLRRHLHFHHHKQSGQASDLEERGILNGDRWGLLRLVATADGMLSLILRGHTLSRTTHLYVKARLPANASGRDYRRMMAAQLAAYVPLGHLFWAAWHAFVVYHAVDWLAPLLGYHIAWPEAITQAVPVLNTVVVCWVAPNVVRSFCLHFISSNMHYWGDVVPGNVMQQCQVLNHPLFWPMQLFCFNFGATHAIHHFVVGQPFYLRQMIAPEALAVMREMGVRFNDLGTFRRANRLNDVAVNTAR